MYLSTATAPNWVDGRNQAAQVKQMWWLIKRHQTLTWARTHAHTHIRIHTHSTYDMLKLEKKRSIFLTLLRSAVIPATITKTMYSIGVYLITWNVPSFSSLLFSFNISHSLASSIRLSLNLAFTSFHFCWCCCCYYSHIYYAIFIFPSNKLFNSQTCISSI